MPSKQTADYNFAFCVQRVDALVISISCVLVHVKIISHCQVNWYSGLHISFYKNGVADILELLLTPFLHLFLCSRRWIWWTALPGTLAICRLLAHLTKVWHQQEIKKQKEGWEFWNIQQGGPKSHRNQRTLAKTVKNNLLRALKMKHSPTVTRGAFIQEKLLKLGKDSVFCGDGTFPVVISLSAPPW